LLIARKILAAAGVLLATCTFYTGSVSNLFERPLTWFSYVADDDIRKASLVGGREYFRVVYKTIYEKQIRTFEMRGVDGGAR